MDANKSSRAYVNMSNMSYKARNTAEVCDFIATIFLARPFMISRTATTSCFGCTIFSELMTVATTWMSVE